MIYTGNTHIMKKYVGVKVPRPAINMKYHVVKSTVAQDENGSMKMQLMWMEITEKISISISGPMQSIEWL